MEGTENRSVFAVAAPGVEELLTRELRGLGIDARAIPGGAEWEGDLESVQVANLHSRLATRVVVRVAEFRARTFHELERHAARVRWGDFLPEGQAVHFRVSCRKSKLYHEGAVAERLRRAAAGAVEGIVAGASATDEEGESGGDVQLIVVRFLHDRCTISADSSGEPLYRRGYRQAVARAPLRETLAAAMIAASGWRPEVPLLDPMCGSGSIPIEAALIARDIAPGIAAADRAPRHFAFQRWPHHDAQGWRTVVERARERVRPHAPAPIHASDRDEGAVRSTLENAERAGVLEDLVVERAAVTVASVPEEPGWLISNPPYGVRVSGSGELRNLYAAIGRFARERLDGWQLALLAADSRMTAELRLPLEIRLETRNGGIPVRLLVGPSAGRRG
jgi:putative N6-adenine-specific DNA methylase